MIDNFIFYLKIAFIVMVMCIYYIWFLKKFSLALLRETYIGRGSESTVSPYICLSFSLCVCVCVCVCVCARARVCVCL